MLYDMPKEDEAEPRPMGGLRTRHPQEDPLPGTESSDTTAEPVLAWLYVLDAWEGGMPSARYLGVMADAAEIAGAPSEYVHDLRTRPTAETWARAPKAWNQRA